MQALHKKLQQKKKCTKCGKHKRYDAFFSSGRNRLKSRCKTCIKEDKNKYWYKRIYFDTLQSKKKKNLPFNITPEYILLLYRKQEGKCYWFGVPLKSSETPKDPQIPTLDRIDRDRGYTKDNVVLACFAANIGRNETEHNRFKEFVEIIRENI